MKATEITPKEKRCGAGPCPAVFRTESGKILVVGTIPAANELPLNVRRKIGRGETVVEIPPGVLPPSV
ncbi:MAG: hypothetical protein KGI49_03725 [Patescibacteria group bacterium]|nr:hypothetical protein [Patescibacteria group bacterium]